MNAATDTLTDDAITMTKRINAKITIPGTDITETNPRSMIDAETRDARGTETSGGTKSEDFSEETIATNASAATNTLICDVTTMIATKNTGTAIAGTGTNEMPPRNMTDVETIDVKGTAISGAIRSEGFSAEKSAGR